MNGNPQFVIVGETELERLRSSRIQNIYIYNILFGRRDMILVLKILTNVGVLSFSLLFIIIPHAAWLGVAWAAARVAQCDCSSLLCYVFRRWLK